MLFRSPTRHAGAAAHRLHPGDNSVSLGGRAWWEQDSTLRRAAGEGGLRLPPTQQQPHNLRLSSRVTSGRFSSRQGRWPAEIEPKARRREDTSASRRWGGQWGRIRPVEDRPRQDAEGGRSFGSGQRRGHASMSPPPRGMLCADTWLCRRVGGGSAQGGSGGRGRRPAGAR